MIVDGREFDDADLDAAFDEMVRHRPDGFTLVDVVRALRRAGVDGEHKSGWDIVHEVANRYLQKKRRAGAISYVGKGKRWKLTKADR